MTLDYRSTYIIIHTFVEGGTSPVLYQHEDFRGYGNVQLPHTIKSSDMGSVWSVSSSFVLRALLGRCSHYFKTLWRTRFSTSSHCLSEPTPGFMHITPCSLGSSRIALYCAVVTAQAALNQWPAHSVQQQCERLQMLSALLPPPPPLRPLPSGGGVYQPPPAPSAAESYPYATSRKATLMTPEQLLAPEQ